MDSILTKFRTLISTKLPDLAEYGLRRKNNIFCRDFACRDDN